MIYRRYIDNAPSALTSLLNSTATNPTPPSGVTTIEEVTVKKVEISPSAVKRRSGAPDTKRGLLDFIQDKFTKKDEAKGTHFHTNGLILTYFQLAGSLFQ